MTPFSLFRNIAITFLIFLVVPVNGAQKIKVDYKAENDFLPYKFEVLTAKQSAPHLPEILKQNHVLQSYKQTGDTAIFLNIYNPSEISDQPAIFSYQNFSKNCVIDDNPIRMVIKDSELYTDSTDHAQRIIAVGYKNDSAYVVQNKYLEDRFDKKLLYVGVDGTGDGKWIPHLQVILISDYDFDGHQEAFVYLNSIREKTPRILYCLELPSLKTEWELPVSPLLNRKYMIDSRDSLNPAIWFIAYNPKQGSTDEIFSDLYAYLVKVNNHGEILFNKIISNEYAAMSFIKDSSNSIYYISHSIPFTNPDDTLTFPGPVYKITAINNKGEILFQTETPHSVNETWFADYNQDGVDEIYALTSNRRIFIYDKDLNLIAYTDETNIGSYATSISLPYYKQKVLVFTTKNSQQDLYSPQLHKLAITAPGFGYYEPITYNADGEVETYLASGGGRTYFVKYSRVSFFTFVKIAFWKYEKYIIFLLTVLIVFILVINHSRLKSLRKYREAEEQYHALLSNIPVGVYRSSINGEALMANEAMYKMYGCQSFDEFKSREVFSAYYSMEDRENFIERLKKEGSIANQEFRLKRKDGSTMWVSTSAYGKFDDQGNLIYFDGIDVDITEKKEVELALLESEARFKGIVEEALVGIFLIEDYKLKYINNKLEQIIGYSLEESFDTSPLNYVHPDDVELAADHMKDITEGAIVSHSIILKFLTKSRQTKFVEIYASNIVVQGKSMVIGTLVDITEKMKAEQALQESLEFNRTVLANSPLGISVRSKTGKLLSVNKAWMEIWRHNQDDVDELMSRPRKELNFDDTDNYLNEWMPKVKEVYEKGGYLHVPEVPLLKYKNRDRWVSQYFYAIKNDLGEVERVVVLTEDITSRKQVESKLHISQAQLNSILESTKDYILLCNTKGESIYFNSAYANIMNYMFGVEMKPGLNPIALIEDEKVKKIWEDNYKRVLSGEHFVAETSFTTPQGKIIYFEHNYNPIFEAGEVIGFSSFTHNITDLKEYAKSIEQNYQYQSLLNELLEIALDRKPLARHLHRFLEVLTGAPFLPLKSQGAIFITDENGSLSLKASLNLPPSLNHSCASVEPGQCLCGKVAQTKKLIYKAAVDHEHEVTYDGIEPHGHYCLPILSKGEVLGVINLYLDESHLYDPREEEFLTAAATTLAGVIERQKIEERLNLMLSAVEQSKEGLAIVDLEGNINFINQAFAQMHGYTPDELYGKNLEIFHDETQLDAVAKANRQIQAKGDFIGEIGHIHRDGHFFPTMMHNSLLKDEDGNPIGMIGTMRDISDLKRSEMALQESEQQFRTLAELTATGIFIYKEDSLVYANPMAQEITGYSLEELNEITIWGTISPEYRETAMQRGNARLRGENVVTTYEMEIISKSGERKWILYTGTKIDYENERAILGTFFDITESKRTAEKIKQIERERYNQTKEIAGGVAHEIYNSLFPATSTLDKLKQRLDLRGEAELTRNKKLIDLAETAIWRALSMTETVTQFSRLDTIKDIEIILLTDYINDLVVHNNEYQLRNVKFELDIEPAAALKINRNHLYSLINNLISNAIDAMADNDKKRISITIKNIGEFVKIEIADNGPGIPPEIAEKVFDPFFSTKPRTGTGLGLAICKKIVDIYDGQLTLDSHLDEGSKFVILLKAPDHQ